MKDGKKNRGGARAATGVRRSKASKTLPASDADSNLDLAAIFGTEGLVDHRPLVLVPYNISQWGNIRHELAGLDNHYRFKPANRNFTNSDRLLYDIEGHRDCLIIEVHGHRLDGRAIQYCREHNIKFATLADLKHDISIAASKSEASLRRYIGNTDPTNGLTKADLKRLFSMLINRLGLHPNDASCESVYVSQGTDAYTGLTYSLTVYRKAGQ